MHTLNYIKRYGEFGGYINMKAVAKAKSIEIQKTKTDTSAMVKSVIVSILSLVLSSAKLFGSISPFSVAFLCGLPGKYAITGVLGSIIGCILFSSPSYTLYYIVALLIVFSIKYAISRIFKVEPKAFLLSLITFFVLLITAFLFDTFYKSAILDTPLMLIEAFLAGALTYFYAITSNAFLKKNSSVAHSYIQLSSLAILFITMITALSNIQFMNINLGVIVGVVAIYIAMNKYGVLGSSIGAIIISIALNMYSIEMMEFSSMLIIASFFAGVFSPLKKVGQLTVFITTSTFYLLLLGAPVTLSYRLIEIFFATAIYILIPQKLFYLLGARGVEKLDGSNNNVFKSSITAKLNYASETIKDLQNDLIAVSKKFTDIDKNNISSVYDVASGKVCKGCSMMLGCWDKNYNDTLNAFAPVNDLLRKNGEVKTEEMPRLFKEKCCKLEKLTQSINECYNTFTMKEGARVHVAESRGLVVEQFNSIANMLLEVSEEFGEINSYDENTSLVIEKAFTKIESKPLQVISSIDKYGRMCVEIYSDNPIRTSARAICETIRSVARKDFDLPSISSIGTKTKIALFEKATYTADFSAQQFCYNDNTVCGDNYEYFLDSKGYAYMILSDGMGNGRRAAIDSVMTCSILLKLIKAGFGLESAIKLINSSLLVKSTDESLATIDIAKIDLYTGKAEFLKAGAADSFIYSKNNCVKISSSSLPVGIIQGIEFDRKLITLKEKDLIILVSDGMTAEGDEWITDEIKKCSHLTAREISIKLIHEAKRRLENEKSDDVTVMVLKLETGI